jgi:outer membrane protein assembly factor BamA
MKAIVVAAVFVSSGLAAQARATGEQDLVPQYTVEAVVIRGNSRTDTAIIRRHVLVRPGDLRDEVKIEESRFRLLTTGWFKDVKAHIEKGSERGKVAVVFTVEERGTLLIDELHIGFSDVSTFWAGIGATETNFLGKGIGLSGGFLKGEGFMGTRLRFMNPDFLGSSMRLGLGLMYNDAREATVEAKPDRVLTLLEYRRVGADVLFGRRLENYFYFYADYRFEADEAKFTHPVGPAILSLDPGRSYVSALTFSMVRDTHNDLWLPTRGSMINLSVKLSSKLIGSNYDFSKYTLDADILLPTFRNHSWKLRAFGGLIQGDNAPFFEKYFVGDYFYFTQHKSSLPRVWEINVSGVTNYKTVAYSGGMEYAIPIFMQGQYFYRGYVYAGVLASRTATVDEIVTGKKDPDKEILTPVSFDLGVKLDTSIGIFTLSLAYWMDLLID